jgi:hypothetical protein
MYDQNKYPAARRERIPKNVVTQSEESCDACDASKLAARGWEGLVVGDGFVEETPVCVAMGMLFSWAVVAGEVFSRISKER